MEYLNLPSFVLDSPEFVGADQVERGTWLCLQRYCIGQENSGVIEDCAIWKDRQWQQLCRVTLREVRRKSRLFRWEGNNLRVFYYPQEAEDIVKAKRLVAQANGKLGGRPSKNPRETHGKPTLVISEKAKGNGMEGNEIITPLPPLQGGESEGADGLVSHIQSLGRGWAATGHLTKREARALRGNEPIFAAFTAADWEVQCEFLKAPLPEGTAYFKPDLLEKFLSDGGCLRHARDWKSKQRPRLEVVTAPLERTAEDEAALLEFLKKPEPKRMNS
jgi:hypothetical protein